MCALAWRVGVQGWEEYFTPTLPSIDQSQANNSPNSHQKEDGVVKLNVRRPLLQTLRVCEVSPKGQLSLPASCSAPAASPPLAAPAEGKSLHWDAAWGC